MKIGIDIRTLMDGQYSGIPEYTHNLVKALLKDETNEYCLFYNSGKDITAHLPQFPGTKIIHRRYPNKIFNYILQKFIGRPLIDKLLGVDLFFMPHFNFISLSPGVKKIITIHDLSFLKFPKYFSIRKNIWHKMINVKKLIKSADHVIAISHSTKNDIIELCNISPDKITVIHSGLSDKFSPITDEIVLSSIKNKYNLPDKYILFLGTIEPRKNIGNLITAYEELITQNRIEKDCNLVIAGGKGWKSLNIYKQYENSAYKDRIAFIGYVDDIDKSALYSLAEIFVYPSLYEGFGFPVLEAMACGTPVITSSTSSLPEVVEDSALLINPHNTQDMSNAIELLINNNNLRVYLTKKGFERIKMFDWTKTAKEYINIFNK